MSAYTENPFASTQSLDQNPFDDPNDSKPPSYALPSAAAAANVLSQRERDLEAREAEIARREHNIKHGKNNFPPFFPLVFHSIADEIPEVSRPLITRLFQLWLVLAGTLVINLVACILILTSGGSDGGKDLGASIMYLPVISVLSFLLWYRPIYNGYMKEQSLYYYAYFFFGGFHLLFSVYMIIGIPSTGSAGLINMVAAYTRGSIAAGVFCTVATVGWVIQGLGNAFYYRIIWRHGHEAGHSVTKAKGEFAQFGAKAYFTRG